MKGDFSRFEENNNKNYSRVLQQQGRVLLDSDWNEQSAILLHYLRTLATDLIGPHGGPGDDFEIKFGKDKDGKPDLIIKQGHYYVDGILCENDKDVSYFNQPNYPVDKKNDFPFPFLAYLDVWERHITCFEDKSLYEVALGGIDTTTRTQVVWQVKLYKLPAGAARNCKIPFKTESDALLAARTLPAQPSDDPCNIEPDARYRGAENQLYRVEIHTGSMDEDGREHTPTFKWSRENGSVVFSVISITESNGTTEVALVNLGHDDKSSLREGDWVEIFDDAYTLQNRAGNLLKIVSIDRDEMSVNLNGKPKFTVSEDPANHPLLRRWDQKAGNPQEGGLTLNTDTKDSDADNAAEIVEGKWLMLEDGVQIQYQNTSGNPARMSHYRTGDYWFIRARTATGDVEWIKDASGNPEPQPPHGIEHHYAPLGIASNIRDLTLCRCKLHSVSVCPRVDDPKP